MTNKKPNSSFKSGRKNLTTKKAVILQERNLSAIKKTIKGLLAVKETINSQKKGLLVIKKTLNQNQISEVVRNSELVVLND